MRIMHVVQTLEVGGLEQVVASLCRHQLEEGHHVSVVTYRHDGAVGESLRSAGIKVHCLSAKETLDLLLPVRLARFVLRTKPDVIHTHHLGPFIYAMLSRIAHWRPIVHSEHSVEFYNAGRRRVIGRLMSRIAHVVCVAEEVRAWRTRHLGTRNETVIPNGVALAPGSGCRSEVRASLGLSEDAFVIGCIARLAPEKDHATLVRAFAALPQYNSHLVLIGDGTERVALKGLVEKLGVEHNVHFLGERHDVSRLIAAFDLTSLSSLREGLPMAALESLSQGVPVVATAVGGLPGLLELGGGVLVPPGKPALLARALMHARNSKPWRSKHGHYGQRLVEERYSSRTMARRYQHVYEQARVGA